MQNKYIIPSESLVKSPTYIAYHIAHQRNGFTAIHNPPNPVKIYTIEMVCVLFNTELPVYTTNGKKKVKINSRELYLDTYFDSYIRGQEHFNNSEKIGNNILYGANSAAFIQGFTTKYLKNGIKNLQGWNFYKTAYPEVISKSIIEEVGFYCGLVTNADLFIKEHIELFKSILENNNAGNNIPFPPKKTIDTKPKFNPDIIEMLLTILYPFFHTEVHTQLKELFETGNDASKPLVFDDGGNRLADTFKQLIKTDLITSCNKQELENWILKNFYYKFRNENKAFTKRYLNDIISSNKDKCQKPIINVKSDSVTGLFKIVKA
jgi:hypothetical protein